MKPQTSSKYQELHGEQEMSDFRPEPRTSFESSETPFLGLQDVDSLERSSASVTTVWKTAVRTILVLLLSISCFIAGYLSRPGALDEEACLDTAWDEVRGAMSFKTVEFNPRFTGPPSPYMGPPTPEVDRLWYDLSELRNFGVDRDTLAKMNRTKGAVEFPGTKRFQVGMEAFHQLHCLNYLRMYSYRDHYEKVDFDMIAETPEERRDHKDHCVEVLRQKLMCNPDLNVYSYHWVNRHEVPWGNLYTSHRCVDWNRFYKWSQENIDGSTPLSKPDNSEVWD